MFSNHSNGHVSSNTLLSWRAGVKKLALVLIFTVMLCSFLSANQWTRFRGPNGQGHSPAMTLPISWSPEDYRWATTLPGPGHSSPVIWGDKLFITCCDPKIPSGTILALSTSTGKILWQKTYPLEKARMNTLNSYASTTPAVDKNGVYVIWPTLNKKIVVALDHFGNEIWKKTFGETVCKHGPSVSPMLFDGLIIFTHNKQSRPPFQKAVRRRQFRAICGRCCQCSGHRKESAELMLYQLRNNSGHAYLSGACHFLRIKNVDEMSRTSTEEAQWPSL